MQRNPKPHAPHQVSPPPPLSQTSNQKHATPEDAKKAAKRFQIIIVAIVGGMAFIGISIGQMAKNKERAASPEIERIEARHKVDMQRQAQGLPELGQLTFDNPYPASSPMHKPYARFLKMITSSPEFIEYAKTAPTTQAALDEMTYRMRDGLVRLDDAHIERYVALMLGLLPKIQVAECAKIFRGEVSIQDVEKALMVSLSTNDRAIINEWYNMVYAAGLASLRQDPIPPVSKIDAAQAGKVLIRTIPENQRDQIFAINSSPRDEVSDEQVCWAGRMTYHYTSRMPTIPRRILQRSFVNN